MIFAIKRIFSSLRTCTVLLSAARARSRERFEGDRRGANSRTAEVRWGRVECSLPSARAITPKSLPTVRRSWPVIRAAWLLRLRGCPLALHEGGHCTWMHLLLLFSLSPPFLCSAFERLSGWPRYPAPGLPRSCVCTSKVSKAIFRGPGVRLRCFRA